MQLHSRLNNKMGKDTNLKQPEDIKIETPDLETDHEDELLDIESPAEVIQKCSKCPYQCISEDQLHKHLLKHELQTDAIFKCATCTFYVNDKEEFLQHLQLHETKHNVDVPVEDTGDSIDNDDGNRKRYKCGGCPYVTNSKTQFFYHKQFHRPRNCPYKCNYCTYNVTKRHLLTQHIKIHGPEQIKIKRNYNRRNMVIDEHPRVWVEFDNQFVKMYKCRQCPQTSLENNVIAIHEKYHTKNSNTFFKCDVCSFAINDENEFNKHERYHTNVYGTVHCLVDSKKSDEEQIAQLYKVLGHRRTKESQGAKNNILYFCDNCPGRFLNKKEFNMHEKFHNAPHPYRCPCCNYTGKQVGYLNKHILVHTEEYQDKTKILQQIYSTDEKHKQPRTAILMDVPEITGPAWITVSMTPPTKVPVEIDNVPPKKYYRCKQCPSKFHKFPALKLHRKLHGSKNSFKCNLCDYAAKTEVSLQRHNSDHLNSYDSDFETPINHEAIPIKLENDTNILQDDTLVVDSEFGILIHGSPQFIYPTNVKNGHMKQKQYKCHKCPSAFDRREQYKTHIHLHGSKQKYKCKLCDYAAKHYSTFAQHITKHQMNTEAHEAAKIKRQNSTQEPEPIENSKNTNPAPLKLSVADRQTLMILEQRRALTEEQNTNNNPMEDKKIFYPCPICPYASVRRNAIDNHLKRHPSISGLKHNNNCPYCDYSVASTHYLKDHVKLHFLPLNYRNKLETYMIYDKLEIWSKTVPNKIDRKVANKIVFKENSDAEVSDDCETDEDISDNDDVIKVNTVTGEVHFGNTDSDAKEEMVISEDSDSE